MSIRASHGSTNDRGQALSGALAALAVLGAFVLVAVMLQPSLIQGRISDSASNNGSVAATPRGQTLDNLAAVIAASAEVIAVHERGRSTASGGSPFAEIVLRTHDSHGSEFIRPDEIAVISHSRVLQTVMFYGRTDASGDDLLYTRAEVASPAFGNRWRHDPAVEPRIIAAGVSDLRAELLHDPTRKRAFITLALTWEGDRTDAVESSVTLEVRSRAMP